MVTLQAFNDARAIDLADEVLARLEGTTWE